MNPTDQYRGSVQEAMDYMTVNPLTEIFECSACGQECLATLDALGYFRNPNEKTAVVFSAAASGEEAAIRPDFCSVKCANNWMRLTKGGPS